jgi:hypothetical protein
MHKLDKPIQVMNEQVSYHSANYIGTANYSRKCRVMSEVTHVWKSGKLALVTLCRKRDGKAFHKSVPFESAPIPSIRCRKAPRGDLAGSVES